MLVEVRVSSQAGNSGLIQKFGINGFQNVMKYPLNQNQVAERCFCKIPSLTSKETK